MQKINSNHLLKVDGLSVSFVTRNGIVRAAEDISFTVDRGKTTAIIGESGSGKSVSCYSLLGLIPTPPGKIDSGSAIFAGEDLLRLSDECLRKIRGRRISMIFQDPMTCLNPFMTIGKQLAEPLIYHEKLRRGQARDLSIELLKEVGIRDPEITIDCFPHEFSGGMRQRVMIAMALINKPELLIADEPTTALDVTIQDQILSLITELQIKRDLGVIFISHDLSVVSDFADEVIVMQKGRIVESGDRNSILGSPRHPYTKKLLSAVPRGGKAVSSVTSDPPLVKVSNLNTWFSSVRGRTPIRAVSNVSFSILSGEVVGLVGESGSGKSTLGRSILQLIKPTSGSVKFADLELTGLDDALMKHQRRFMQIIFQDPFASLNPRMTVFDTLAEPMQLHRSIENSDINDAVFKIMNDVGLARSSVRKYPHEFSGGQRQRIAIGRALAVRPKFIVADEPVSALDVTIQSQVLNLIQDLIDEYGLTMLFISHDLSVIRKVSDRILIMHKGSIVEEGSSSKIFEHPENDYTRALIDAIPGRKLQVG